MKIRPTNVRWTVFGLAFVSSWLLYLHRYAFAFMKPWLMKEWGIKESALGELDSAFSLAYSVCQVPMGIVTDVWGVRLGLTLMTLIGSLGLGLHAAAGTVPAMWLARVTLGVGQSASYAALNRLSRSWFPLAVRTTWQGLVGVTAGRIGGLSASLLFGTVLLGYCGLNWRTATCFFMAIGLVQTATFFFAFRNTPEEHGRVNEAEASLISGGVARASNPCVSESKAESRAGSPCHERLSLREFVLRLSPRARGNLAALNVQTVLSTFADNLYSNWIPLFLASVHGLKWQAMGIFAALPLLGGALAGVLGGWLNDRFIAWTGNRRWTRSGVGAVGKGLASVWLLVALAFYDRPYVFCGMLFLVKLCGDCSVTTMWGVVTDIGGRATASVYAFNNAVAGIGSVTAPIIIGYLAQHYGWRSVFATVGVVYALCAASWLWVNCTIPMLTESERGDEV